MGQLRDSYTEYLRVAAFEMEQVELLDEGLVEMVQQIRMNYWALMGLNKLNLLGGNFSNAKQLTKSVLDATHQGQLGHAIITASKPRLVA